MRTLNSVFDQKKQHFAVLRPACGSNCNLAEKVKL